MKISEAIEELVVATRAAGYSEQTADFYVRKLKPLVAYLEDMPVEQVTTSDLRRFVAHLRARETRWDDHPNKRQRAGGLSEATLAGIVRAVRRLFAFLLEEKVIADNPAARLKQPKPRRGEPKAASMEDLLKLLDASEGDDPVSVRNRAMLLVLADTACRVGGLVGMRLADLNLDAGQVYLHEKGNKGRYAFVTPMTVEALQTWLALRPPGSSPYLWSSLGSGGGEHLSTQGVREVFRRMKAKVGVTGPINPHAWRHAFAREYLKNGGDLASLADYMGHADVTVTHASYAIFRTEELKTKHARHSPLAHLRETRH
jgi:site-specific recombinase XerD